MVTEYICLECETITPILEFLTGKNPFDPRIDILGCPKCKAIDNFRLVCDELGCRKEVTCGTPIVNGYRRTCSEHAPRASQ